MSRILVVDDSPTVLTVVQLLLTRAGHKVYTAMTVADGLARFRAVRPDLVVTDLSLTGDGLALVKQVLTEAPHVPIVVMSGHPGGDLRAKMRAAGLTGRASVLEKPFANDVLLELVLTLTAGGSPDADCER